jgi:hypothetical protein
MAMIKCKECNKEVSNQADRCPNCGAPIKKSIGCLTLAIIIFVAIIILGIVIEELTKNRHSETFVTTTKLDYNLSKNDLKVAQDKLNFVETISWFGGEVNTGKIFKQYVNVVIASKEKQRDKLMLIVQFYRIRYRGCESLIIYFYPSVKNAPKTKSDFNKSLLQPNDESFAGYNYEPVNKLDTLRYF